MYTNENAKVNVQCPDEKATLEFKPASYVSGGNIGNLVGSWGNVNIDTTCAITVLIPTNKHRKNDDHKQKNHNFIYSIYVLHQQYIWIWIR